jgi:hypothetical protein
MTRTNHLTAAELEELIAQFGATVAARTIKEHGTQKLGTLAAYEVYDEARDIAWDLLSEQGDDDLMDELLGEVTDEASARILETVEDLRHNR